MPIQRTHRVPVLLLTLLVATLLLPRACDDARLTVGSWLPATVRPEPDAPAKLPEEQVASLRAQIERLREQLAARPGGESALAGARYATRRDRDAPVLVPCRVLHRETSPARRTLMIDAGQREGVAPGMPVVQQDSLIGIVSAVSAAAARVVRIDDRAPATAFSAVVLAAEAEPGAPARSQGVARGSGDGLVRVSFLPQDGARPGDLVVTGAGSRVVPEGLLLGVVESCTDDDRDGAFDAVVRPLRDLDQVSSVYVLQMEAPGLRVDAK
jgi:rod shape-determining protein MreC